jgi:hypothetical protein
VVLVEPVDDEVSRRFLADAADDSLAFDNSRVEESFFDFIFVFLLPDEDNCRLTGFVE